MKKNNIEVIELMFDVFDTLKKYCDNYKEYLENNENDIMMQQQLRDGIISRIQQLCELSYEIGRELENQHDYIDFGALRKIRNVISHNYEGIEDDVIDYLIYGGIENLEFQFKHLYKNLKEN